MPVSLNNPPYIFAIKTIHHADQQMTRVVQVAGRKGDVGRVAPIGTVFKNGLHAQKSSLTPL